MLGKDLFKVEVNSELTSDRFKSLVLFYGPLIGSDALYLYEFLLTKGTNFGFDEISKLLNSLLMPIDKFEELLSKLNEYKLIKTLKAKDEDKYVFVLNTPLSFDEFIKDDILVRDFILKTSGEYYQSLLSNIREKFNSKDYIDVSKKIDPSILSNWNHTNEAYLNAVNHQNVYDFNTFFNVNDFLNDVSTTLLPLKYRTEENLREMALLADLYNISYEKMRTFLPRIAKTESNDFDLSLLRYLCENSNPEFKTIEDGDYNVPCELFLMNKQDGKVVTPSDKRIIYNLYHDYHLAPNVINVLLEHALNNSNNTLIEKYLYAIASDLHRNNIEDTNKALERLNKYEPKSKVKKESIPVYSTDDNPTLDVDAYNKLISKRK